MSLLAALPIIAVIVALLLRLSTTVAATIGLAVTVPVTATLFPLPGTGWLDLAGDWSSVTVEVLLIILGGIAFAEIGRRTGAQAALSDWLRTSLGSGIGPTLAIVHGLTPMTESLTGYGIGAALAIPLLAALGLPVRRAAAIGLLGLCAVPWGSMGPGTLIAAQLSGVGFQDLGVLSALVSLPVFLGVGWAAVLLTPDRRPVPGLLAAAGSALALWLAVLGTNLTLGTAPAGAVGGLLVLGMHLLLARTRRRRPLPATQGLRRALVPYGVLLVGVVLAGLLVRLGGLDATAWQHLSSPALWLLVASGVSSLLPGTDAPLRRQAWSAAARSWLHVGPATAMFIVLGALMAASQMSATMAAGLVLLGPVYPLVVPFLAGLGGFVTGSNTGANAMLAGPQTEAITDLGLVLPTTVAVHNVAAAVATMAAPARVELSLRLAGDTEATSADRNWVQYRLLLVVGAILAVLAIGLLILATV